MSSHADRRAARDAADHTTPTPAALHAMCLRVAASYRQRLAAGERECLAERHAWALRRARAIRLGREAISAPYTGAARNRTMGSQNSAPAAGAPSLLTQSPFRRPAMIPATAV